MRASTSSSLKFRSGRLSHTSHKSASMVCIRKHLSTLILWSNVSRNLGDPITEKTVVQATMSILRLQGVINPQVKQHWAADWLGQNKSLLHQKKGSSLSALRKAAHNRHDIESILTDFHDFCDIHEIPPEY